MPISQPGYVQSTGMGGSNVIVNDFPPDTTPTSQGLLWYDSAARSLYISLGTATVLDWSNLQLDSDIIDKILVVDGQVLTQNGYVLTT